MNYEKPFATLNKRIKKYNESNNHIMIVETGFDPVMETYSYIAKYRETGETFGGSDLSYRKMKKAIDNILELCT